MRTGLDNNLPVLPSNALLVVDDEQHICSALKRVFRPDGYRVFTATSADKGMQILRGESINVIIADQRMPRVSGTRFLASVQQQFPETVRMILSGYADLTDITEAMDAGSIHKFLTKPWDDGLLRANVREAFARAEFLREQAAQTELARLTDVATGLPNAKYLSQAFEELRGKSNAVECRPVVLHIAIDQLRDVRESLGFEQSEALAKAVAARLSTLSQQFIVARLSTDEFALMGDRCEVNEQTTEIAGRIRSLFDRPLQADERVVSTTVSIGVAIDHRNELCLSELLGQASAAATVVRERGGNDFELFADQMRDAVDRRLFIEVNLKRSLKLGQFVNLYQPQVEIISGRIVGLEALLRWQHPEIGPVSPAEFIPIAERSGTIVELGKSVLRAACRDLQFLRETTEFPGTMAVNVSPRQLTDPEFVEFVRQSLKDFAIPTENLVLELTEAAMIEDHEATSATLAAIREAGISLAIDDFGTGYASHSTLTHFPFDKVKVDRCFITQAQADPKTTAVLGNMIRLATELGLATIVEGVETPDELKLAHACGANVIQGYFYSPPVSKRRIRQLLEGHGKLSVGGTVGN